MIILLRWLVDFAWILYAVCAIGALAYIARALSVQRRMNANLTTFEQDTSTGQVFRLWRTAAIFLLVGVAAFAAQVYLLPQVLPEVVLSPTPTLRAGLETATPTPTLTSTPEVGVLPAATLTPTPEAVPTPLTPEPEPTDIPALPEPAYPAYARVGNVAEFLGYDVESTEIVVGQPIRLTLYWRALGGAGIADYWVFTHLLPPDLSRIVAQHDSQPAGGTRPTTGWASGEVIADVHELTFSATDYVGVAQFAVGIYVPDIGRVPVDGGSDYILLPVSVNISAP